MATPRRRSSLGGGDAAAMSTPRMGPTPGTATPSSTTKLRPDDGSAVRPPRPAKSKVKGLDVVQNVAEMLSEMVTAAESKSDVVGNDVVAEMVSEGRGGFGLMLPVHIDA